MTALELLLTRFSNPNLTEPAPSGLVLENILSAAMAVPDHGGLSPFSINVIKGDGLDRLTTALVKATKAMTEESFKIEKATKMAFRAPMIIVVSTCYQEHPKVPKHEQMITAGCALQAMQMACVAQGYQGMWRTGDLASHPIVKDALGVSAENDIVGFLYVGSSAREIPEKRRRDYLEKVTFWD
ncbi:NAD(P)H nitroreductase [Thalassotalea mangrovi]|uniref:Putative NAD(P)H nitroreductase n=1 Tax=Thalassotalea mangrovi TaxID=2572245 RepID=A0A4U1B430_9GAMM|nr:NAD(P)H nitroreductase [Thalassotalea mangrovi]TKB44880.1 NAD(P)H nitroreductase [Thalassotalea mangrovi]